MALPLAWRPQGANAPRSPESPARPARTALVSPPQRRYESPPELYSGSVRGPCLASGRRRMFGAIFRPLVASRWRRAALVGVGAAAVAAGVWLCRGGLAHRATA